MAPQISKLQSSNWFLCRYYGCQGFVDALTGFVWHNFVFWTREQHILSETVSCQKLHQNQCSFCTILQNSLAPVTESYKALVQDYRLEAVLLLNIFHHSHSSTERSVNGHKKSFIVHTFILRQSIRQRRNCCILYQIRSIQIVVSFSTDTFEELYNLSTQSGIVSYSLELNWNLIIIIMSVPLVQLVPGDDRNYTPNLRSSLSDTCWSTVAVSIVLSLT